jgi:hypothetical protein
VDSNTRRTRFETRILLEREFLARVNNVFAPSLSLAGMTRDAIESWSQRASAKKTIKNIFQIARLLIEVSEKSQLLADNSKDVFEAGHIHQPDSLAVLRDLLDRALAEVRTAD